MNLALGALIITLLLLPALFFRIGIIFLSIFSSLDPKDHPQFDNGKRIKASARGYRELVRRNVVFMLAKLNFTEIIFLFLMIPLVLHMVSLCAMRAFKYDIDFGLLLNLFTSKADVIKGYHDGMFLHELISFLKYISLECLLAMVLGWLLGEVMLRCTRLTARWFLGTNIWYELFTGLTLNKFTRLQVDLITIEVYCQTREASVIYSGALKKFDIIRDSGELAYVTLWNAAKRDVRPSFKTVTILQNTISDDKIIEAKTESNASYTNGDLNIIKIPGHSLTIKGSEIANVNVYYHKYIWQEIDEKWTITGIEELFNTDPPPKVSPFEGLMQQVFSKCTKKNK